VLPDGKGGLFLVTDQKILRRGPKGKVEKYADVGSSSGAVALAPDGSLYVGRHSQLYRIGPDRRVKRVADGLGEIFGVAVGPRGAVYATDWKRGKVWKVVGAKKDVVAKGLEYPSGLVCDPKGTLYVKESGRQTGKDMRIRRIRTDKEVTVFATVDSVSRFR
jgi:glucose/arabinose dehydrogenase